MLILTRRIGEAIIIGDDVKIILLNVNHNQIRLGIDAPKNTSVHREEVYLRIQKEAKERLNNGQDIPENFGDTCSE